MLSDSSDIPNKNEIFDTINSANLGIKFAPKGNYVYLGENRYSAKITYRTSSTDSPQSSIRFNNGDELTNLLAFLWLKGNNLYGIITTPNQFLDISDSEISRNTAFPNSHLFSYKEKPKLTFTIYRNIGKFKSENKPCISEEESQIIWNQYKYLAKELSNLFAFSIDLTGKRKNEFYTAESLNEDSTKTIEEFIKSRSKIWNDDNKAKLQIKYYNSEEEPKSSDADDTKLFHYTNISGFKGIIEKSSIWLSDSYFMNDEKENDSANTSLKKAFDEFSKDIEHALYPNISFECLDKEVDDYFSPDNERNRHYIACFCLDGDLLSQWRGYGDETSPISLGFSKKALEKDESSFLLLPVIYGEREGAKEIKNALHSYIGSNPHADNNDILKLLSIYHAIIKDLSFAEEAEWRLFSTKDYEYLKKFNQLKFRESSFGITPYIIYEFESQDTNENGNKKAEYIKKIIQGPRLYPKVAIQGLKQFSEHHGIKEEKIHISKIPLRRYK